MHAAILAWINQWSGILIGIWGIGIFVLFIYFGVIRQQFLEQYDKHAEKPFPQSLFVRQPVKEWRRGSQAVRNPSPYPEVERLRKKLWQAQRQSIYWMFGIPLILVGLVVAYELTA